MKSGEVGQRQEWVTVHAPPETDRILFLPAGQRVPEKILFLLRSCAAVTGGAVMNSGNQHV